MYAILCVHFLGASGCEGRAGALRVAETHRAGECESMFISYRKVYVSQERWSSGRIVAAQRAPVCQLNRDVIHRSLAECTVVSQQEQAAVALARTQAACESRVSRIEHELTALMQKLESER